MNRVTKENIDKRFYKALEKAQRITGYVSLDSIVGSQYYFPRKYSLEPKRVIMVKPHQNNNNQ
ncbi:hypothetical protein [Photobacterium damselae]|uniref:hypothetical protein n=1 Tax=Photobacterium damselae TaxID=38293 RepID=UPI001F35C310|nr:hypothetical protein [Photobacterium damselae]UKA03984.1 hypothetical protein IHC89_15765 [Photobacterium damselae subsp. damselae]UKA04002.1 hypothetical protein IHC89_15855 [Photobacterium damselae subsp. damselae]